MLVRTIQTSDIIFFIGWIYAVITLRLQAYKNPEVH